jgi:hypothetical protein
MSTCIWMARWLAGAIAAMSLIGCAVVDQYSGRAVAYNVEAEHAQGQALLLNIVRAYLRRPMQFTTVSNIVGTATATGNVGYTAPVNIPFRPAVNGPTGIATFPSILNSWSISGSMSGGPTFTVPVLDTQEFYNGLLRSIPPQLWNFYEQQGYERGLLFNLFVDSLVMRKSGCEKVDHNELCEIVIHNDIEDAEEIQLFQTAAEYLLSLGLTTERENEDSLLKPDPKCRITDEQRKALKDGRPDVANNAKIELEECETKRIDSATNVNVKISGSVGGLIGQSGTTSAGSGSASSPGDTSPNKYSLCFSPRSNAIEYVGPRYLCGMAELPQYKRDQAKKKMEDLIKRSANECHKLDDDQSPFVSGHIEGKAVFKLSTSAIRELERLPVLGPQFRDVLKPCEAIVLSIRLRTTEGVIRYLGALARRELSGARDLLFLKAGYHEGYDHPWACVDQNSDISDKCRPIFHLNVGADAVQSGTLLSIYYDGQIYSIPNDGVSGRVLEVLKEALALSSSSKSLPQSNVVSVVGGQ